MIFACIYLSLKLLQCKSVVLFIVGLLMLVVFIMALL